MRQAPWQVGTKRTIIEAEASPVECVGIQDPLGETARRGTTWKRERRGPPGIMGDRKRGKRE